MGSDFKKIAGVAAAPFTGGTSLLLTGNEYRKDLKEAKSSAESSAAEAAAQNKINTDNATVAADKLAKKKLAAQSYKSKSTTKDKDFSPFKNLLGE